MTQSVTSQMQALVPEGRVIVDEVEFLKPPGLRMEQGRATEVIVVPEMVRQSPAMRYRLAMREMPRAAFIECKGSGTLRKNARIGMKITRHYLIERTAYEFGYPFEACAENCVLWGEPRSEADCKPVTEAGWHVERYASMCLFPGDEMECKYLEVEREGVRREGMGIVIRKTSAQWIPEGFMVFCIITEYDKKIHDFRDAVNPC